MVPLLIKPAEMMLFYAGADRQILKPENLIHFRPGNRPLFRFLRF